MGEKSPYTTKSHKFFTKIDHKYCKHNAKQNSQTSSPHTALHRQVWRARTRGVKDRNPFTQWVVQQTTAVCQVQTVRGYDWKSKHRGLKVWI
jgi:hypothetical protein